MLLKAEGNCYEQIHTNSYAKSNNLRIKNKKYENGANQKPEWQVQAILPSQKNQREVELYSKDLRGLLLSSKTVQKNIFIMEGAPECCLWTPGS